VTFLFQWSCYPSSDIGHPPKIEWSIFVPLRDQKEAPFDLLEGITSDTTYYEK